MQFAYQRPCSSNKDSVLALFASGLVSGNGLFLVWPSACGASCAASLALSQCAMVLLLVQLACVALNPPPWVSPCLVLAALGAAPVFESELVRSCAGLPVAKHS